MSWNGKPRISLSDMQAMLASNREMLQKNSSPTKTPSKSYLRRQRKLQANAKFEDEAEAKIEVEANAEVFKDTEITKIMKNQQEMKREFMKMLKNVTPITVSLFTQGMKQEFSQQISKIDTLDTLGDAMTTSLETLTTI